MITVVLVDDDAMVRTGLRMIIGGDPELSVVGEAEDGESGLQVIDQHRPDVVLLDIRMPRLDGLGMLERLAGTPSPPRVLVLTTFNTDDYAVRALGQRAQGFLLKDADPGTIIEAIKATHRGEPVLSPAVTATVIEAATAAPRRQPVAARLVASLTEREREVAIRVAQGMTNAEIAAELHLGLATVKAHLTRTFDKLGADNRVSVAMVIRDAGLLDE